MLTFTSKWAGFFTLIVVASASAYSEGRDTWLSIMRLLQVDKWSFKIMLRSSLAGSLTEEFSTLRWSNGLSLSLSDSDVADDGVSQLKVRSRSEGLLIIEDLKLRHLENLDWRLVSGFLLPIFNDSTDLYLTVEREDPLMVWFR